MKQKSEATHSTLDLKLFLDFLDSELWNKWHIECGLTTLPFYLDRNRKLSAPKELMQNEHVTAVLLKIVRDDNWDTHIEIDMKNHSVKKSYVEAYLKTMNDLQDEACKKHRKELTILIYYAVASRFFIEKTLQKLPLPSTKVSFDKALADYELLKKTPGKILDLGSMQGKKAVNFFMEDIRFECPTDAKTYREYWNNPILIGRIVTWMKHNKSISNATFNRLRNDTVVSPFRPAAVKYLVHYIHEKDTDIKISSYLNLCGGWGCRLLGALSTPEITRYIQTDPNTALIPISKKIHEIYDPQKETEVHFYDQPMEDLNVEQLCPQNKKNQLIFFSPPFYNKEKYKGKNQSHTRYPALSSWCDEFLYQSLKVSYFSLENGILAINLANILNRQGDEIKLTDCLVHLLEVNMANYFTKFAEPLVYPNKNAPPSYVFMYKTKPYHDSLGIFPKFVMQSEWVLNKADRPIKEKKNNANTTTTTPTLAIEHRPPVTNKQGGLLPHVTASMPSIEQATLANLHRSIEHFSTLEEVAQYYKCSALAVIKRISDWDLKLSYSKLKYNYASPGSRTVCLYKNWHINGELLYIDNQPFNPNVIYLSAIINHPINNHTNSNIATPENNLKLVQVICINPLGTIVYQTINLSQLSQINVDTILNYLSDTGLIKKCAAIPHYNECKSSKRFGIEHLSLTLAELHEIILSEPEQIKLAIRLGKTLDSLESDFAMLGISPDELKNLNPQEASILYGSQYKECIGTIIGNKLQHQLQNETVSMVNEAPIEEKEMEDAPAEKTSPIPAIQRPAPRAAFNSSLFIPKQTQTKRTYQQEGPNKKPRTGP